MTYLMEPHSGSVQTVEEWAEDGFTLDNSLLIEVEQDSDGDWVEVE